jgi:tight adherence protein C
VITLVRGQTPIERRLAGITDSSGVPNVSRWENFKRSLTGWLKKLAPSAAAKKDDWTLSKTRTDLVVAGFRTKDALGIFMGIRVLSVIGLPLMAAAVCIFLNAKHTHLLVACAVTFGLGFILPTWILEKMAASRGNKILRQMPNMLDLLVVAVESGLGLDAAILRVTRDLTQSCPTLSEELALYSLELRLGATREDALKNLSRRTGVDDMSGLVAMLVQADRFGVSVGRSLRVFANEMRTKRRQKLEEMAAKIPLKLLIPVLFMIFPAIMAVMAGPAVINVMENMF